jgi:CheY-like chemotaxis protein
MLDNEFTILVVDDVDENRTIIERILRQEGYRVETAEDGREALKVLGRTGIDLAIVDINMPLIDGISLLKQIRAEDRLKFIPVIMLTALEDKHTTLECVRLGASGYVTKPFDRKNLIQQIDNCIAKPE